MGRKFTDRTGQPWMVEREHGRSELVFRPVHGEQAGGAGGGGGGGGGDERTAPLPSHAHTQDPYELSDHELQRLLDRSQTRYRKPKGPPPF